MCLAVAARVIAVETGTEFSRPARVALGDDKVTTIDLVMVPEAEPGDYVLVHSGYAVSKVSHEEAARISDLLRGG